ncbi:hypothetical protein Pcaca02_04640 [Pectobacterium carotovorum subsp. carotovorum]|nr:hypothetical protein Pcaca02_04640 [Pectobacterium carotovorum subsp. carotovorum]
MTGIYMPDTWQNVAGNKLKCALALYWAIAIARMHGSGQRREFYPFYSGVLSHYDGQFTYGRE